MEINRGYLGQLISIEAPEWEKGMANDERDEQLFRYSNLRNAARDLLDNPQDTEARDKLSKLIKELKIE